MMREDLSILCLSSNAGGEKLPSAEYTKTMFSQMATLTHDALPDIIVVGVQEMVELSATNVISSSATIQAAQQWLYSILTNVNSIEVACRDSVVLERLIGIQGNNVNASEATPYELVAQEMMVGQYICMLCTSRVRPYLKNVRSGQCPRGVDPGLGAERLGNKGAVSIRFDVQDSSICLVNAHFAAHREKVQARNDDFHAIMNHRGMFADPYFAVSQESQSGARNAGGDLLRARQGVKSLTKTLQVKAVDVSGATEKTRVETQQQANGEYEEEKECDGEEGGVFQAHTRRSTLTSIGEDAAHEEEEEETPEQRPKPTMKKTLSRRGSLAAIRFSLDAEKAEKEKAICAQAEAAEDVGHEKETPEQIPKPTMKKTLSKRGSLAAIRFSLDAEKAEKEKAICAEAREEKELAKIKVRRGSLAVIRKSLDDAKSTSEKEAAATAALQEKASITAEQRARMELAVKTAQAHALLAQTRYLTLRTQEMEEHSLRVDDHDIVLFLGDLNYRLTKQISDENVFAYIKADKCLDLVQNYDQLTQEMDFGNVFQDFHEGLVTFPPTYKYIPGTSELDRRPEKKNRCPAWCDRILWRTRKRPAPHMVHQELAPLSPEEDIPLVYAGSPMASPGSSPSSSGKMGAMIGNFSPKRVSLKVKPKPQKLRDYDIGDGYSQYPTLPGEVPHFTSTADYASNGLSTPDSHSVQLMMYTDIKEFKLSDHRPVKAMFNLQVRRIDWAAREALLQNIGNICIPRVDADTGHKMAKGTSLVSLSPTSSLLYSHNREFTQQPVEVRNNSSVSLLCGVNPLSLVTQSNIEATGTHGDVDGWLRINHTRTIDADGTITEVSDGVKHEWNCYQHAAAVEVPPGGSVWWWLTCNNVAAMRAYADTQFERQGSACGKAAGLLSPLGEELIEVCVNVEIDVWEASASAVAVAAPAEVLSEGMANTSINDAAVDVGSSLSVLVSPQQQPPRTKLCSLNLPVVLVLGPEPDGAPNTASQVSQIDTSSLHYRLQRKMA